MGTIRKIGRNWQVDACRKGVRVRKIVGPSKRVAQDVLSELEGRLVREEYGLSKSDASISQVFDRFLSYAKNNLALMTVKRYSNVIDRFHEFLAANKDLKLCSHLNMGVIESYRQFRLSSTHPPKTKSMNFELKALRTFFNYAMKWKLIRENPTTGIRFQRVTDAKALRFLSKEEISLLLDH